MLMAISLRQLELEVIDEHHISPLSKMNALPNQTQTNSMVMRQQCRSYWTMNSKAHSFIVVDSYCHVHNAADSVADQGRLSPVVSGVAGRSWRSRETQCISLVRSGCGRSAMFWQAVDASTILELPLPHMKC